MQGGHAAFALPPSPLPALQPRPGHELSARRRHALCWQSDWSARPSSARRARTCRQTPPGRPVVLCSSFSPDDGQERRQGERPIGAFDSGVGGLSVLREIRRLLPREDLLYIADSAYCPYGTKPVPEIQERTLSVARHLVDLGAKLIVVACNSACVAGLDAVRQELPAIPIIGVEPAIKPAQAATRNGRIGVLATSVTLKGARFASLVHRFASDADVFVQPAPGLVNLVEAGDVDSPICRGLLNEYLTPLLEKGVDTLILGCTHYPFLRETIQDICGDAVVILDTGEPVARHVARILERSGTLSPSVSMGQEKFYTTGSPSLVQPVVQKLWNGTDFIEVNLAVL